MRMLCVGVVLAYSQGYAARAVPEHPVRRDRRAAVADDGATGRDHPVDRASRQHPDEQKKVEKSCRDSGTLVRTATAFCHVIRHKDRGEHPDEYGGYRFIHRFTIPISRI